MSESEKPTAAFIVSLLAGLFIILGGLFSTMLGMVGFGMMGGTLWGMRGMMGGVSGLMMREQQLFGVMTGLGLLGTVSGIIVLVSAIMLNSRPLQASTWGTLILAFSVVSVFSGAMGGFVVGLILGIVGGALAIAWKPAPKSSASSS